MAYTKTNWSNGGAPAINETNLNKIEQGIYDATYVDGVKVGTSIDSNYKTNILYSANIFDESTYTNGMAWNNATGFPSRATAYCNITAGKTYSISAGNISRLNGGGVNVFEKSQSSASTNISSVVSFDTDGSLTFTASSGATVLAIQLSIPSGNISSSNYPDIMIVEGSTPKPYAKYVSQPTINVDGEDIYVKGQNDFYSTQEQVIGTWIDGKLLYEKTIYNTLPNTSTSGTPQWKDLTIAENIDMAFIEDGYIKAGNNIFSIFSASPSSNANYFARGYIGNNLLVFMNSNYDYNGAEAMARVRYTKTTD